MVLEGLMQHGGVEVSVIELEGWQILGAPSTPCRWIPSSSIEAIYIHGGWGGGAVYTHVYPIYVYIGDRWVGRPGRLLAMLHELSSIIITNSIILKIRWYTGTLGAHLNRHLAQAHINQDRGQAHIPQDLTQACLLQNLA